MNFNSFYEEYAIIDSAFGNESDMLIHFRITSRGATRIDNCHPFQINDKMAFIHNGTISSIPIDKEHGYSDTYWFNELILKDLPKNWEDNSAIKYLIEDTIGFSKIVMLHATKGIYIFNEDKGVWHEGCWYSNTTYEPRKYYGGYNRGNSNYNSYKHSDNFYDGDDSMDYYEKWNKTPDPQNKTVLLLEEERKKKEEREKAKVVETLVADSLKENKEVDSEETIVVKCDMCQEYKPIENMFTCDTGNSKPDIFCEDCVIQMESIGMCLTYINLDKESYDELFNLEEGIGTC